MRRAAIAVLVVATAWGWPAQAADWPQLGNGPQHLGYSPEKLRPPLKLKWNVQFQPERLYPALQPVVAAGRVFLGTERGNLYAVDAATAKRLWKFPPGADEHVGPILHTAGVEGGRVFFASMDGCVYALEAESGKLAWKFGWPGCGGFSTAVLLAEGMVFAASRRGSLFRIRQADGKCPWVVHTGVPLLQSLAYNDGRIYGAGMDMRLRAFDARTGKRLWWAEPVKGLAFKDYWPVVYKGLVIVRPMGGWHTFAFEEKTGRPVALKLPSGCTMNGAVAPPCVDRDGKLVTGTRLKGTWQHGWARFDVETHRVEEISAQKAGRGNGDENMAPAAAGDLIFAMHCEEGNAQYTGCYDLRTKTWTRIRGGPWLNLTSNTQGGGASQAVVAAGRLYHVSLHGLRCFEGGE